VSGEKDYGIVASLKDDTIIIDDQDSVFMTSPFKVSIGHSPVDHTEVKVDRR
jgi:hypothetical protein